MVLEINSRAICEEEIRTGFTGYGGLDPPNRLSNGTEFKRPDAGGSEERSEYHVISRGDRDDVIGLGIDVLDEPTAGPARAQNHHSRLLIALCGTQSGILALRVGAEMPQQLGE